MKSLQKTAIHLFLFALTLSVYGQQNNNRELSLSVRQKAMVPIAAFAAKGDHLGLSLALNKGLDAGLTVNEIKEILVQLYAYAGFPRSLNAISTFQMVVNTRKDKGVTNNEGRKPGSIKFPDQKYQYGKDVQAKLTGRSAISTQEFVPVIDTFLKEHLFADIFGRDNLDFQSREIATISILASIGRADAQLRSNLRIYQREIMKDAAERYKELLRLNPQIIKRLSNKIVASYLNMSPETLSRLKTKL
ncbi:carboxymuconolactone decarboxylase family protein [Mucilaginibacter jinjuensis]|uniref:Carboxymuconolactone decarboxylase family protein n=1 Tax=Mucilaginibacter jinjuensis TaxID=1176721 RepID=A0ABY7TDR2_9SPHI|nr:carboxymuconolactone decarboxylase family protein [Mucilaginibacter jinjuensis]WCT14471.1 carboxymuconolactone decarboxylase family protein [Mucilaginibacter jinjuensis]